MVTMFLLSFKSIPDHASQKFVISCIQLRKLCLCWSPCMAPICTPAAFKSIQMVDEKKKIHRNLFRLILGVIVQLTVELIEKFDSYHTKVLFSYNLIEIPK